MKTVKTNELQGAALDWAVAKCEGLEVYFEDGLVCLVGQPFDTYWKYWNPTTDWAQGGPIIEREWLDVTPWPNESREDMRWHCQQHDTANDFAQYGPTLLIAAMRCYVAYILGDEVEVPEELLCQS